MSLSPVSLVGIANRIKEGKVHNIICMTGAGISCSAGIPDFRTPGTGLYDNLQQYNLPRAESIFELDYFRERPKAFCTLAKELYPGVVLPTPAHHFITLLHQKGLLLRCFTQNIDGLELEAGLPSEKLVQVHGGFQSAHCIDCKTEVAESKVKATLFADGIPRCPQCEGLVKPDILFFGEPLNSQVIHRVNEDFPECDLLIVMGTSLSVAPFCTFTNYVEESVPRLLINLQKVGMAMNQADLPPDVAELLRMVPENHPMRAALLQQLGDACVLFGSGFGWLPLR
jgi:NAD-dependent deacetylase sirtuin 2